MRHNRKFVMKEQYQLYMKKNFFNGRYFTRNLQLVCCFVVTIALVLGIVGISSKEETNAEGVAEVSVKEALFGNSEENNDESESTVITEDEEVAEKVAENSVDEESATTTEETTTESIFAGTMTMGDYILVSEEQQKEIEAQGEFYNKCIANVEDTLNIRQEPDADAEFVGSMNVGAIAVVQGVEGEWTRIKSGEVEGYVLTEYVLTGESAVEFAKDYGVFRGTVLEDGVNVRAEASTDAEIVTILEKDDTITVLEDSEEESVESCDSETCTDVACEEHKESESQVVPAMAEIKQSKAAADEEEIDWIAVMLEDGQVGYVSSDFLDVEKLYEIAISAEELQRIAEAEEAAKKAAAEQAYANSTNNSNNSNNSNSNSSNNKHQGATTVPLTALEPGELIGYFSVTAYCSCPQCCNNNITATGTICTEGRTIAADPTVLPYGTQVVINGTVYTVEDCGGAIKGNVIDIYFATHERAIAFGRQRLAVYKY